MKTLMANFAKIMVSGIFFTKSSGHLVSTQSTSTWRRWCSAGWSRIGATSSSTPRPDITTEFKVPATRDVTLVRKTVEIWKIILWRIIFFLRHTITMHIMFWRQRCNVYKALKTLHPNGIRTRDLLFGLDDHYATPPGLTVEIVCEKQCDHIGRNLGIWEIIHRYLHWYIHRYLHWYIHRYLHWYIHRHLHWYIHRYLHWYICKD
jgi:hypothetical protein